MRRIACRRRWRRKRRAAAAERACERRASPLRASNASSAVRAPRLQRRVSATAKMRCSWSALQNAARSRPKLALSARRAASTRARRNLARPCAASASAQTPTSRACLKAALQRVARRGTRNAPRCTVVPARNGGESRHRHPRRKAACHRLPLVDRRPPCAQAAPQPMAEHVCGGGGGEASPPPSRAPLRRARVSEGPQRSGDGAMEHAGGGGSGEGGHPPSRAPLR